MPANLSPEYKQAEHAYRAAREPRERLDLLKEMLRAIPKHKGTEHLQADIKSRIKELSDELTGPKKGGARAGHFTVRREGAAQVCLVGPPNAGKSTLHAALTRSHSEVGPFPYTTKLPVPGMLPFEDIAFQLVDLPPLSPEHIEPGTDRRPARRRRGLAGRRHLGSGLYRADGVHPRCARSAQGRARRALAGAVRG